MAMIHLKKVQIVGLKKFFWAVYSPLDGRAGAHRFAKGLLADGPSSFSAGLRLMRAAVLALVAVLSLSSSPVRALLSASLKSVESIDDQSSCNRSPYTTRKLWYMLSRNFSLRDQQALSGDQSTSGSNSNRLVPVWYRNPSLTVVETSKPLEFNEGNRCTRSCLSSDGNTNNKSSPVKPSHYDSASGGDSVSTTEFSIDRDVVPEESEIAIRSASIRSLFEDILEIEYLELQCFIKDRQSIDKFFKLIIDVYKKVCPSLDSVPEAQIDEENYVDKVYEIIAPNFKEMQLCLEAGCKKYPNSDFFKAILPVVRRMNKGQIIPNADLDHLENVMNLCKSDSKEGVTISIILRSAIDYNYDLLGNNL
jgi:hypothetical protein